MSAREIRLACVQMRCTQDREENLNTAERLCRRAAEEGAQVILLPELLSLIHI